MHLDDGIPLPSSQRKAADGFSGALKDKAVVMTKLNPQTLFERENPKVRLMCDLNKIMVGHREFSFEEIRRQCYERSGCYSNNNAPTEKPVTPISSSALLNVRSKEKGLKNRTPSDIAAVVIQKTRSPKIIGPPPPLKPNEKWQCDINAMYHDGQEWSFEQLRAQYYAVRVAVKPCEPTPPTFPECPPVELKIASLCLSEPIIPVPPQKLKPPTREIAIQTDLFGLDFDIQLVPRLIISQTPSPRQAPEQNSAVASVGGSSPTVNTKQALSSVKSWFNASVLLPEPKADPKPVKKSIFSIFKDPSVLDVPDERSHAPAVVPKPFTVFIEPEVVAAAPLQTKRFAIMDENVPTDQENVASFAPSMPKVRKPLSAIIPLPTCQEPEEENVQDDFKENVPPSAHVQEIVKRQLSGILVPSVDIPCDPVGLVEDDMNMDEEDQEAMAPAAHVNVSRALFAGDEEEQTRHYCIPLNDDVDFTVPSAMAFANNLRIQSTPLMHSRHQQPLTLAMTDEATFNLPRGRVLQVTDSAPIPAATVAASSKTLRGLSPIDERSREYFSSSGSSAGTTGLAHSRLSVGRSLHCSDAARIFPPHFDPFDMEHRQALISKGMIINFQSILF